MKESAERIGYIVDYLTSYEQKISALNRNGLYDAAALYEMFAIEICNLWFGQTFLNLNFNKSNYPYVDLVSKDSRIYVQVTTQKNIPLKIKETLEKLRDSKRAERESVEVLYFFILDNPSIANIQNFSEEKQIGSISFDAEKHLITLDKIINRAKSDRRFMDALYNLIKEETEEVEKQNKAIIKALDYSKSSMLESISYLINDKYEVDRSELLSQIRRDKQQFISIQGEAGSGKSGLCKKLLEEEPVLFYTRAETIAEVYNLDQIWGFDISQAIKLLKDKHAVFFVDALEFIADSPKNKFELLQYLYKTVKPYKNAQIVTSCRTSDYSAFKKLNDAFSIAVYQIQELTERQLQEITNRYPIIGQIAHLQSYSHLVRLPFYINLIVSQVSSIDDISEDIELREYIWKKVICLEGKTLSREVNHIEVKDTINDIVFRRAKEFSVGVPRDSVNAIVLKTLISEGIAIAENDKVRLKYDIFEDICFERFFDAQFEKCKGQYNMFYDEIKSIGRCVYRRYQIWIENKLFVKDSRAKFLYNLIIADCIPEEWEQQTLIGIVKSRFCSNFFCEYEHLIANEKLALFLKIINTFSFDLQIIHLKNENVYTHPQPIGQGRCCLINIIHKNEKYKERTLKQAIGRLCEDYSQSKEYNQRTAEACCSILEYYAIETMAHTEKNPYPHKINEIADYLNSIYRMAEYASDWIRALWGSVLKEYKASSEEKWLAEELLKYTLDHTTPGLVKVLSRELCALADAYWFFVMKDDSFYDSGSVRSIEADYGLNKNAHNYEFTYKSVKDNLFLQMLLRYDLKQAIGWIINLTNQAAVSYKRAKPKKRNITEVWFSETGKTKQYISNADFWQCGTNHANIPLLINDAIHEMGEYLEKLLSQAIEEKITVIDFAYEIRRRIYEESNNTMPLTIIAHIGTKLIHELPSYALDLCSSIDIVRYDINRYAGQISNPEKSFLERQIILTAGIPGIEKRYTISSEPENLRNYIMRAQLIADENIRHRALLILDYLYKKIPDEPKYAEERFMLQNMDIRLAQAERIDENRIALIPKLSGEAEKAQMQLKKTKTDSEERKAEAILTSFQKEMNSSDCNVEKLYTQIETIWEIRCNSIMRFKFDRIWVTMVASILMKPELNCERRKELCNMWIESIRQMFDNETFMYDYGLTFVLFKQLEFELMPETVNAIKELALDCLIGCQDNGIIREIKRIMGIYLKQNQKLARSLFYTVLALAKDSWDHYQFDLQYRGITELNPDNRRMQSRKSFVYWTDKMIEEKGEVGYSDHRKEFLQKYLFDEESFLISNDIDINSFDLEVICYAINCGLSLESVDFFIVMHSIILNMVLSWHLSKDVPLSLKIEMQHYCMDDIDKIQPIDKLLDLMFNDIDYSLFTSDSFEFYEEVFSTLTVSYFNSHSDTQKREICRKNILSLENRISLVTIDSVRIELENSLLLSRHSFIYTDGNMVKAGYTYSDKQFLIQLWSRYGSRHLEGMLYVIYNYQIKLLLPEILVTVYNCLMIFLKEGGDPKLLSEESKVIMNEIITKAYLDCSDSIKGDEELTQAYEEALKILTDSGFKPAAILLDEFRIH